MENLLDLYTADLLTSSTQPNLVAKEMVVSIVIVVVVVDNNIQEKPHSLENKLIYWHSTKTLLSAQDQPLTIWLHGMDDPVLLFKQVFKNEDGSKVVRYLVAGDLMLCESEIIGIYQN